MHILLIKKGFLSILFLIAFCNAAAEDNFFDLNLSTPTMQLLLGNWTGEVQIGNNRLNLAFVFQVSDSGSSTGTLNILPTTGQGLHDAPINKASLVNGALILKLDNASYDGRLSGNTITGNWTMGDVTVPLTLIRSIDE